MPQLRGCPFPDDLLYEPDSHLWFAAVGDARYRVGVTRLGIALSGEILLFTPKRKFVAAQMVAFERWIAMCQRMSDSPK